MKILIQIRFFLSTLNKVGAQNTRIKVPILVDSFRDYFLKESINFEMPLRTRQGVLSYTGRFAKTVINIEKLNIQLRKSYFKKIKRSILNSSLTPASCSDLCESFINFPFEGDEDEILNKMRDYAENNLSLFTCEQSDRFNLAHQYLMIQKLQPNMKFVDFQLKSQVQEKSRLKNRLRWLFKKYGVKQYSFQDWANKQQLRLSMKINNTNKNLTIKGINLKAKNDEVEMIINRIISLAKKQKNIQILPHVDPGVVSQQMLSKHLLVGEKPYDLISKTDVPHSNDAISSILKKIKDFQSHSALQNISVINVSPISYLNEVLSSTSEDQLRQAYGYIKFNIFHLQYHKLLKNLSLKKLQILKKQIPSFNLQRQLECEEKRELNFLFPGEIQSKMVCSFLREKEVQSLYLVTDENFVYQLLEYLLFECAKEKQVMINPQENRNLQVLKRKLALISVIYNLSIDLPVINETVGTLKKGLFPLTHQYRL